MSNKISKFLTTIEVFLGGALLSSLILYPSNIWKIWLTAFVIISALERYNSVRED